MRHKLTLMCIASMASATTAMAQIKPEGQAARTTVGGVDVCLFTDGTTPSMSVTSNTSTTFQWKYAANDTEAATVTREQTGTTDKMNVGAPGIYSVTYDGQTYTQWWLSPKPAEASFQVDSVTCEAVYVTATCDAPAIRVGSEEIKQNITYEWSNAEGSLGVLRSPEAALEGLYDEGQLKLTVTNQAFNSISVTDSVFPVAVKAGFSFEKREKDIPNEATVSGEALSSPADVTFKNESKGNVTVYEWAMGTVARLYDESPIYQFQKPGTYKIALTVTNEAAGCSHTDTTTTIIVSEADIEFPDAFTPNGDGTNDLFLPAYRSLKTYELTIYNRWGREVFHTTDPTAGWDGKEHGRDAAAGVYYFVSYSEGYEKGAKFWRKGSITLIR